jgi:hypothetical protein
MAVYIDGTVVEPGDLAFGEGMSGIIINVDSPDGVALFAFARPNAQEYVDIALTTIQTNLFRKAV